MSCRIVLLTLAALTEDEISKQLPFAFPWSPRLDSYTSKVNLRSLDAHLTMIPIACFPHLSGGKNVTEVASPFLAPVVFVPVSSVCKTNSSAETMGTLTLIYGKNEAK